MNLLNVVLILFRKLVGLKAAHLNQEVVLTGGTDGAGKNRDEVLNAWKIF